MEFKRIDKGTINVEIAGELVGHVDFTYKDAHTLTLDSTEVDPEHRGQQIAKKLVTQVVEFARSKNLKIIPVCPYAVTLFERMSDWEDVKIK